MVASRRIVHFFPSRVGYFAVVVVGGYKPAWPVPCV